MEVSSDARPLLERLVGLFNDLGLLAEASDTTYGRSGSMPRAAQPAGRTGAVSLIRRDPRPLGLLAGR